MWDVVATAAAGFQAGAGIQAAVTGTPDASDTDAVRRFTHRSRVLSLLLGLTSSGAAIATFSTERRGPLWLVAAASAGISVPFNLLIMSPPHAVHLSKPALRAAAASDGLEPIEDEGPDEVLSGGETESVVSLGGTRRRSKNAIFYARGGVLVNPEELRASWTRKYWFQAGLAATSFVGMIFVLTSKRNWTPTTYAPL